METQCVNCGAGLRAGSTRCVKCGSAISLPTQPPPPPSSPFTFQQPVMAPQPPGVPKRHNRNKAVAAILAILLGGVGAHRFYLGQGGWGLLYLFLCWTYIPAIAGIVEGIIYLTMSDEAFDQKYNI